MPTIIINTKPWPTANPVSGAALIRMHGRAIHTLYTIEVSIDGNRTKEFAAYAESLNRTTRETLFFPIRNTEKVIEVTGRFEPHIERIGKLVALRSSFPEFFSDLLATQEELRSNNFRAPYTPYTWPGTLLLPKGNRHLTEEEAKTSFLAALSAHYSSAEILENQPLVIPPPPVQVVQQSQKKDVQQDDDSDAIVDLLVARPITSEKKSPSPSLDTVASTKYLSDLGEEDDDDDDDSDVVVDALVRRPSSNEPPQKKRKTESGEVITAASSVPGLPRNASQTSLFALSTQKPEQSTPAAMQTETQEKEAIQALYDRKKRHKEAPRAGL